MYLADEPVLKRLCAIGCAAEEQEIEGEEQKRDLKNLCKYSGIMTEKGQPMSVQEMKKETIPSNENDSFLLCFFLLEVNHFEKKGKSLFVRKSSMMKR